jgi:uncharacterized SAM-binding protein YcdF (DUF218 family)
MFFVVSKIVFAIVRPVHFLILMLVVGLGLGLTRWRRFGQGLIVASTLMFVVFGFTPIADGGLAILEDRFPPVAADGPPPDGILVLGGAIDTRANKAGRGLALNDAAERMTEVAALAQRYPAARIVFTGGDGELFPGIATEAETARILFSSFGIPADRMVFEDRSRNTWENAVLTKEIVKPQPGQRWFLITSAFHMPRSVGIFRKVEWPGIVAYPTDYRTGSAGPGLNRIRAIDNLQNLETLAKEVIGLVAYRLTGKTDALFPAP